MKRWEVFWTSPRGVVWRTEVYAETAEEAMKDAGAPGVAGRVDAHRVDVEWSGVAR